MMILSTLSDNLHLFPHLPWTGIVIATLVAYAVGWVWYGVLFRKQYQSLRQNNTGRTNWAALVAHCLGTFVLAYLIGIFSLFETMFLLGIDALMGIVLFFSLAGCLFHRGSTRETVRFWIIVAGYEMVAILSIALVIVYLA